MSNLVFTRNDRPVTDSLTVARVFEKRHDNVLQDIRNLGCSENFSLLNFEESTYTNERGREYPRVIMTEQGFTLLVMGYTGVDAMCFKERYIAEFERMRAELAKPRMLTRLELIELAREAELARIEAEQKRLEAEQRNAELQHELRLQEPKVALYDVAMSADNAQPIGTVAKSLNFGPNKLFSFLREKKVLMSTGSRYNQPYQEYIDRGYFRVRQYTITHFTTGIENKTQTLVTAKGLGFIYRLLEEAGHLPQAVNGQVGGAECH